MNTVWKKVEVNIVHLPSSEECYYLVMVWDDLSGWLEWYAFSNATAETVVKFLYQNNFCHHSYLQKFIMNEGPENKKEIEELLKQYEVRKVTVSAYYSQINEMIEQRHMSII